MRERNEIWNLDLEDWIAERAELFDSIREADLEPLMERIGESRIVLIGEGSHGTSEFYRMRQRITAELIEKKGFRRIGIEGDWPDVERIDEYVRGRERKPVRTREAFDRFPSWMWRNREVLEFVDWLESANRSMPSESERVGIHGLDLYSLYSSIHEVMNFLERAGNPRSLEQARKGYNNLLAYEPKPQNYAQAVELGLEKGREKEVLDVLSNLFEERLKAVQSQRGVVFDAEQNARVVANAEEYYRSLFRPGSNSWNLRDSHMFETMKNLLTLESCEERKMVVWAHNSHVGDARFTEMGKRGEHNIGQLARQEFGSDVYSIGFGTHTGSVAAADDWGMPMKVKAVNPSMRGSHERICFQSHRGNFLVPLREARNADIGRKRKYERAIGVIYRPQTEFQSHYFEADLPGQFDEYIWFEASSAVIPLAEETAPRLPKGHPFAPID